MKIRYSKTYIRNLIIRKYIKIYSPYFLSIICKNSFFYSIQGLKNNRLAGLKMSYREIRNIGYSNQYPIRLYLGIHENGDIILCDGRHLLEAYRLLQKGVPYFLIGFVNNSTKKLFTSILKGIIRKLGHQF